MRPAFYDDYLPFTIPTDRVNIKDYRPSAWRKLSPADQDRWVDEIARYWLGRGFPYPQFKSNHLDQIYNIVSEDVCQSEYLLMNCVGVSVPTSYMPHIYDAKVGRSKTVLEAFHDDVVLRQTIRKYLSYNTSSMIGNRLRSALMLAPGVQAVTNFKPAVAKYICDEYCSKGGVIYDYSCGYGGRMVGALVSRKNLTYIGVEPCTKTFESLKRMGRDLFPGRFKLEQMGSECDVADAFSDYVGLVDCAFSSPPYFDRERYSDEPTQSYIKYPTYKSWIQEFMPATVKNIRTLLRQGGYSIVNVAPTSVAPTLDTDVCKCFEDQQFNFVMAYKMVISQRMGKNHQRQGIKYEPVYVFKKM